jgi:diacylglycerol kinase (ATP)
LVTTPVAHENIHYPQPQSWRPARQLFDRVLSRLSDSGASCEIVETLNHVEGLAIARTAARSGCFDAIVAAGGDGTVHDVAEGALDHETPLRIIPLGTANVFAREVGLPQLPEELAETLLHGPARTIPVGEVNGRPFLFVVGVGFDAAAVRRLAGRARPRTRRIRGARAPCASFASGSFVAGANGRYGDGGAMGDCHKNEALCRGSDAGTRRRSSGTQLHVLCMKGRSPLPRLAQLTAFAAGYLRLGPSVTLVTAKQVRIDGDRQTLVQVDGEALGELLLDINTSTKKLALIFPQASFR